MSSPKTSNPASDKMIHVRILRDHGGFLCGDLASLPAADVAAAVEAGWADDHPDAVAYAKSVA